MNNLRQVAIRWDNRVARFIIRDENDWIEKCWAGGHFYETGTLAVIEKAEFCMRERGEKRTLFIDIGAHRGNHTVFALKIAGFDNAFCFEPIVENYTSLIMNLSVNDLLHQAVDIQAGIWDRREADIVFMAPSIDANSGTYRVADKYREGAAWAMMYPIYVALDVIERHMDMMCVNNTGVLIKCDVEGLESEIVPHLVTTLKVPVISGGLVVETPGVTELMRLRHDHAVYVPTDQEYMWRCLI